MSWRTLVELNHDYGPHCDDAELLEWATQLRMYLNSGDKKYLPYGVTYVYKRHHSDSYPDDIADKASNL